MDINMLAGLIRQGLAEDERIAREACGSTVVGERGNWRQAPGGDEWEAHEGVVGDEELLVALRPGLPRPPDVMAGFWGAVVSEDPDERGSGVLSPMPAFRHAARHDPARVLRDVARDRALLELALGWQHDRHTEDDWYSCSQARDADGELACTDERREGKPCDCGRDQRVLAVLTLLATPYQERVHG